MDSDQKLCGVVMIRHGGIYPHTCIESVGHTTPHRCHCGVQWQTEFGGTVIQVGVADSEQSTPAGESGRPDTPSTENKKE